MFVHWDKAQIALSDNDDICIEWTGPNGDFWLDIDRDGTVRTLRIHACGDKEERAWTAFNPNDLFDYVNETLRALWYSPEGL